MKTWHLRVLTDRRPAAVAAPRAGALPGVLLWFVPAAGARRRVAAAQRLGHLRPAGRLDRAVRAQRAAAPAPPVLARRAVRHGHRLRAPGAAARAVRRRSRAAIGSGDNRAMFSLCVYCGSRSGDDPRYAEAARALGTALGQAGHRLVYGGGHAGLMGAGGGRHAGRRRPGAGHHPAPARRARAGPSRHPGAARRRHHARAQAADGRRPPTPSWRCRAASARWKSCSRRGPGSSSATTRARSGCWTPPASIARCWSCSRTRATPASSTRPRSSRLRVDTDPARLLQTLRDEAVASPAGKDFNPI